jgi:hypothetical protein
MGGATGSGGSPDPGGSSGVGGSSSSGGATAGTSGNGGLMDTGGAPGVGGASSTGGGPASTGGTATGGATGDGGISGMDGGSATGGSSGDGGTSGMDGGSATGGSGTGGNQMGGSSGTGGAGDGGAGGSQGTDGNADTGGSTGAGGSSGSGGSTLSSLPGPWVFNSSSGLDGWSATLYKSGETVDGGSSASSAATPVTPTFYQSAAGTPCENGCAAYSVDFTGTTWTEYGSGQSESVDFSRTLTAPIDTSGATITVKAVVPAASLGYINAAQAYGQLAVSPWTWASTYVGASSISGDTLMTFTTTLPGTGFSVDQVIGFQVQDKTSTDGTGSVTVYIQSISLTQ